ncbi:hypothetical protein HSBAA_05670 [Vreelandella sulfidaeris]|uniref:Uncharacterized protein n=1 Tax=Vreelandella sulfidaeris TaxID=115553 RepID=A0A455U433_9GAMM|nr:hypothetical protein HSBAA_05670 [Halomonas sulfidaeris]
MIVGLVAGVIVWLWGLWVPLMFSLPAPSLPFTPLTPADAPLWYNITLLSLTTNILLLIVISLFTRTSEGGTIRRGGVFGGCGDPFQAFSIRSRDG